MKSLFFFLSLLAYQLSQAATPPDPFLVEQFKTVFPHIKQIDWRENGTTWDAVYSDKGIKVRLTYNLKGEVISCYRYYGVESLCPFIRSRVMHAYPAQRVYGVNEHTTSGDKLYHIVLQDDTHWYHVEVNCYGTTLLTKKYKKA